MPPFEGMDEPPHLSTLLNWSLKGERPVPDRALFHRSVVEAMALGPGAPLGQIFGWDALPGALTYRQYAGLGPAERAERARRFAELPVHEWRDSDPHFQNWQAQHPPIYYALVGTLLKPAASTLGVYFTWARVLSAALFSTTLLILSFFFRRWGLGPAALYWACFLPMLPVMGARLSNDALAIPFFTLFLLLLVEELRKPAAEFSAGAWALIAVAFTLGLGTKAYLLAMLPVLLLLPAWRAWRDGVGAWRKLSFFAWPMILAALVWGWWLLENRARTGSLTGQNELRELNERGLLTLGHYAAAVRELFTRHLAATAKRLAALVVQVFYVSNWTLGAAFPLFYAAQGLLWGWLGWRAIGIYRREPRWRVEPWLAALIVAAFGYGLLKLLVDFYIMHGEPKNAGGWYLWAASAVWILCLARGLESLSPRGRRWAVFLQAVLFVLTAATDFGYWSGRYERDPSTRLPIKVEP